MRCSQSIQEPLSSPAASQPSTALAQLGLAAQARGERELVEPDAVDAAKLAERCGAGSARQSVDPVARGRAAGDDEPVLLEVPQHPRRPAVRAAAAPTVSASMPNLTTMCQG